MARLAVALPGVLPRDGTRVALDRKSRVGLEGLARHWRGPLTLAMRAAGPDASDPVQDEWHDAAELGFDVVTGADLDTALAATRADLVLAPLLPSLLDLSVPRDRLVWVAEFGPDELTRHDAAPLAGAARLRALAGGARRARRMRAAVRAARGLQCNGYAAYEAFAPIAPRAVTFFDSRVTAEHVELARALAPHGERPGPRRLAFSGRLIEAKGPQIAVEVVRRLTAQGVACELLVLGSGPLEAALRAQAPAGVRLLGHVPFDPDWTTLVRTEVDLMLLPHLQGDPSGTYLEAAGCGVPTVGFANVTLDALARREAMAWCAPLGDVAALTELTADLLADPARRAVGRANGLRFLAAHSAEAEYAARAEHLSALLPRSARGRLGP